MTNPSNTEANHYLPSPNERVREQVRLYEASDGAAGGTLEDKPVIILTHTGAKTGAIRKNPIMRIPLGPAYIAVASAAGATTQPAWYFNLIAQPRVHVQDHGEHHDLIARESTAQRNSDSGQSPRPIGPTSPSTERKPLAGRSRSFSSNRPPGRPDRDPGPHRPAMINPRVAETPRSPGWRRLGRLHLCAVRRLEGEHVSWNHRVEVNFLCGDGLDDLAVVDRRHGQKHAALGVDLQLVVMCAAPE
jgi:deazaflavin-dependent oxidoreductase (nitroreductase family)